MVSTGIGYLCAGVSVFCFGTNFIPVKKYNVGDGMFFQWMMCVGIYIMGLIVYGVRHAPQFEPLAMMGGVLWASGNVLCAPIIHFIGMGLGILIWGAVNLAMGWGSGHFGWFGLNKETDTKTPWMNELGAAVCLFSLSIFFFIKPQSTADTAHGAKADAVANDEQSQRWDTEASRALKDPIRSSEIDPLLPEGKVSYFGAFDRLPRSTQRIFACLAAVIAGAFFGINFDPPQYLIDHPDKPYWGTATHSTQGLDYVFSHFCGILGASTFWFLLYYVCMKLNGATPFIRTEIIIPSIGSGMMWGVAQIAWFVANQSLSLVVTFPIISTGPGLVATLWGVFLYNEISGKRNISLLLLAFVVIFTGVTLIALSK